MLLDPTRFSVLAELEGAFPDIRAEAAGLEREEYVPWPDRGAYVGEWLGFPLLMASYPAELTVDFEANRRRCPRTTATLRRLPAVHTAGFSRMEPGCHILPHVDEKPDTHLRAHLGLVIPPGSRMRVGDDEHAWQEGKALVFEGLIDHETANCGSSPRLVLLVDFTLDPEELEYSRRVLRAVEPRLRVSGGGRIRS